MQYLKNTINYSQVICVHTKVSELVCQREESLKTEGQLGSYYNKQNEVRSLEFGLRGIGVKVKGDFQKYSEGEKVIQC